MRIKLKTKTTSVFTVESIESFLHESIFCHRRHGYMETKSIELKIEALLESQAKLLEVLAEKGLITASDIAKVADKGYSAREDYELVKDE